MKFVYHSFFCNSSLFAGLSLNLSFEELSRIHVMSQINCVRQIRTKQKAPTSEKKRQINKENGDGRRTRTKTATP